MLALRPEEGKQAAQTRFQDGTKERKRGTPTAFLSLSFGLCLQAGGGGVLAVWLAQFALSAGSVLSKGIDEGRSYTVTQ